MFFCLCLKVQPQGFLLFLREETYLCKKCNYYSQVSQTKPCIICAAEKSKEEKIIVMYQILNMQLFMTEIDGKKHIDILLY